ncbi:hypothetical protein C0991_003608 [Blastosporella zonata]|nr:hypothetical protein C0991_003608 [Blastosporella zonata]
MPQTPVIHDPGNGPRVRDVRAFLSSHFSQPPAFDDSLCAEFAQEEVLEMLMTILPEEIAYILWYNKSRSTSRICPACLRLYRLGDVLADHISGQEHFEDMESSPRLQREQTLSGLCELPPLISASLNAHNIHLSGSPMCFIAASFSYPSAIKPAWGRMAEELDDHSWTILNGRPEDATGDAGLTMLMRMTRLHDLGLAQLCFGLEIEDLDDTN